MRNTKCKLVTNETVTETLFDCMKKFQVFFSQATKIFITNFLELFKIAIDLTLS